MSTDGAIPAPSWEDTCRNWLVQVGTLTSTDGTPIDLWEFRHQNDAALLSAWAKHFRQHYCSDDLIEVLRSGTGKLKADYLRDLKFPDATRAPGPSIRSGDFAEILVADYVRFVLGYWVPPIRYADKTVRNESTKGSDVLGFRILRPGRVSPRDELTIWEVKAQLTGDTATPRLQNAIDDSSKDEIRKAESLNAVKQRLVMAGDTAGAAVVERFQNFADNPYTPKYGAVAMFSVPCFCATTIGTSSVADHVNRDKLSLMVIRGEDLMALAHQLYDRAANEA